MSLPRPDQHCRRARHGPANRSGRFGHTRSKWSNSGRTNKRGAELGGLPAAGRSLGGFARCFAGSTSLPRT